MTNLLFLDLETTSLDTQKAEVIEVAYTRFGFAMKNKLFASEKPIPPEVSGITNIDNADVEDKQLFKRSSDADELAMYAKQDYIAVCHNTDYDLEVLRKHGIKFERSICTYKLAWQYLPELANHKLGTLRAYFKIPHTGEAHRASYDVKILIEIYKKLSLLVLDLPKTKDLFGSDEGKLIALSDQAKYEYFNTWSFGKFKGEKINKGLHGSYISWLLKAGGNLDQKFESHLKMIMR